MSAVKQAIPLALVDNHRKLDCILPATGSVDCHHQKAIVANFIRACTSLPDFLARANTPLSTNCHHNFVGRIHLQDFGSLEQEE